MRERRSLPARVAAAEATIRQFSGRPFAWGSTDCLRVAAYCLRQLGVAPPLREAGRYASPLGARRALKRTGCASVPEWVDRWGLLRVPPLGLLAADIVALPSGDDAMPSLAVACSGGRFLMFAPELGCAAVLGLNPGVTPLAAWRA